MKGIFGRWLPVAAWLGMVSLGPACLWDRETLDAEKARFPGVEELITGNFPRHSREFYEWRKGVSEKQIAADPSNAAAYDDLAVAQHKLGDHPGAIATMMAKEKAKPGLYETYSNLGTFFIYTGQLQESLVWIDKALAINPDAHFGREKYQRWLVEWVLAGKPAGEEPVKEGGKWVGFFWFVGKKLNRDMDLRYAEKADRDASLKGILGMMRFADFDNPLLQEALGDVLASGEMQINAAHLSGMAYLNATQKLTGGEWQRVLAKFSAIVETVPGAVPKKEAKALFGGLYEGQQLAAKVRADELVWIQAGKDVSAEYSAKYLKP